MNTILRIAAGIVAFSASSLLSVAESQAKQCVWNKAGFILKVDWYDAKFVKLDSSTNKPRLEKGATPSQTDSYPVAQGRCLEKPTQHVAVLSVVGAEWVKKGLQFGIGASVGLAAGAIGAVVCVGTAGTACPAVATAAGAAVTGAAKLASEFIPNPKQLDEIPGTFAVVYPPTDRWIDVWGTTFDPQTGLGGKI